METVKLIPKVMRPIWSGNKISKWNKPDCTGSIGETWELSFLPEGESTTEDGTPVSQAVSATDIGVNSTLFDKFPVLIKFIDAAQYLSVQVHPSDEYALSHGLASGKTEMWYVTDADEGAGLYLGFNRNVTADEVTEKVKNGTVTDLLNFVKVKAGESYFVPSGTVHAIGAGVTVAEIQQSSAVTFRLYDFGRLGADGKPRELHLSQAMAVADLNKFVPTVFENTQLKSLKFSGKKIRTVADCKYFTVYEAKGESELSCDNSFVALVCVAGEGTVDGKPAKKGDTFFVPAGKRVKVSGAMTYLISGVGL